MIFKFIVKWLGGLKSVPMVALVFDSCLKMHAAIVNPQLLDCIDEVENEVCCWEGVTLSLHKYGGTQFNYKQKEIGHLHSNGILDIRLDRETKNLLVQGNKAKEHHVFKKSGWISLYIVGKADVENAIAILCLSYNNAVNG